MLRKKRDSGKASKRFDRYDDFDTDSVPSSLGSEGTHSGEYVFMDFLFVQSDFVTLSRNRLLLTKSAWRCWSTSERALLPILRERAKRPEGRTSKAKRGAGILLLLGASTVLAFFWRDIMGGLVGDTRKKIPQQRKTEAGGANSANAPTGMAKKRRKAAKMMAGGIHPGMAPPPGVMAPPKPPMGAAPEPPGAGEGTNLVGAQIALAEKCFKHVGCAVCLNFNITLEALQRCDSHL